MGQTLYFDSQREAERYLERLGREDLQNGEAARKAGRSFRAQSGNYELKPSNSRPGKWELILI